MLDRFLNQLLPTESSNLRSLAHFDAQQNAIDLTHNDYLGLGVDDRLKSDFLAQFSFDDFPHFGSTASRLLYTNSQIYIDLELLLAKLYRKSGALLYNSGYHVNIGILPAITTNRTLIVADKLVHASIIDGIRLSKGDFVRFRHNDYNHLFQILSEKAGDYEAVFVVTESIFSMDGDCADLEQLVALKHQFKNLYLYVDEAHAVGVRGERGLGLSEELGVVDDIDILVGTFGKAYASMGAFVVGSDTLINLLINVSRSVIYSTTLPAINAAWSHYILSAMQVDEATNFATRRAQLRAISSEVREGLIGAFESMTEDSRMAKLLECLRRSTSQIIPIVVCEAEVAIKVANSLKNSGINVKAIRPPTVPASSSRLRLSLHAALSKSDVAKLINTLTTALYEVYSK